jgi:2-phospho-L-lactate guanylyltransferase
VVTPDAEVAEAARAAGGEALLRPDPGLNPAVEAASAEVAPAAGDGVLVVLGDVAGARSAELAELIAGAPRPGVALAPSSDGGTAALLRLPRAAIPTAFGPESAKRHRALAEQAGVAFREIGLPSLALDLDEPEDLEALLQRDRASSPGRRTRALLRELLGGERP